MKHYSVNIHMENRDSWLMSSAENMHDAFRQARSFIRWRRKMSGKNTAIYGIIHLPDGRAGIGIDGSLYGDIQFIDMAPQAHRRWRWENV